MMTDTARALLEAEVARIDERLAAVQSEIEATTRHLDMLVTERTRLREDRGILSTDIRHG